MAREALIQKEHIQETVRETLLQLGFNLSSPDDIIEQQKDMHFLRATRMRSEAIKAHALSVAVGVVVTGLLGMIVLFITGYRGQ